jgi:YcxB-like protein
MAAGRPHFGWSRSRIDFTLTRMVDPDLPTTQRVSVTVAASFWEMLLAGLVLIRYQGWLIAIHAVFPLAGLGMLALIVGTGRPLRVQDLVIILLALLFTPLILAFAIWNARRRNKLAQGPFTYSFDSEGMHTSGSAFSQTIKWAAIPRVRQTKNFLFIFISPIAAHSIPLRAIPDRTVLEAIRSIAAQHTDFR